MKEDFEKIYQKIILFAKLFNIQATIFEKNEENNFICFYNNNGELAGDIKIVNGYSYAINFYPNYPNFFEGSIKATYNSYNEQFLYFIRNKQQDLTGGITMREIETDKYQVIGCISTHNKGQNKTYVSFNRSNSNLLEIERENKRTTENVGFTVLPPLIMLQHKKLNEYKMLNRRLMFQFSDSLSKNELVFTIDINNRFYKQYLPYLVSKESELYDKLKATDLEIVRNTFNKKGKKLLKFLDSVRKDLIIPTTNGEVISLYDTMANLCFPDANDPSFIFTGAIPQQQEEKGKVLKRI